MPRVNNQKNNAVKAASETPKMIPTPPPIWNFIFESSTESEGWSEAIIRGIMKIKNGTVGKAKIE